MKKLTHLSILGLATIACTAITSVVMTGCEVSSSSEPVLIEPSSVTLKKGQSAQFTATQGYDYEWGLKDETWGTLSSRRGQTVTYTSLYEPTEGASASQVLSVTSTIQGTGGTSNETYSITGQAYITHL